MKKAFYIFFLILVIPACSEKRQEEARKGKPQAPLPPAVKTALDRIAKVDNNTDHYPSRSQCYQEVIQQVTDIVGELSSPSQLKMLFFECHRLNREGSAVPEDCFWWPDPYWEASQTVLFRLAELKSDSTTSVLIDLFTDEDIGWDGESALNICNAISRCGEKAVPYLAEIRSESWGNTPSVIVDCIRKGELYGP